MVESSNPAIIGILLSVISTILLSIATAMPGWYYRDTITFGMWVICFGNRCEQMTDLEEWVHGWRAMLIMAIIASAAAPVCGLISLRNTSDSVKKRFNLAAIGTNFSSGLFDFTGILLVASEVHYHFSYSFGIAFLGGVISFAAAMLMILKHRGDKKSLQHVSYTNTNFVNNANQVQIIPMTAGNQVQTIPMTAGNQVQMIPMTAGNQVQMIPMMAGNQVQMTPMTAGNQVQMIPMTAGNQIQMFPMTAGNQVQLIPMTAGNQTQMVPVNAGNQLQMSPIVSGNQIQVAPMASGNQVQVAPMTAGNQVQVAPLTADDQVQVAPMTAGSQTQVTPTAPGKQEQMTLPKSSIQM